MEPNEIHAELVRRGITLADIARTEDVTRQAISRVVRGHLKSARLRQAVAEAIERTPGEVFTSHTPEVTKETCAPHATDDAA